MKTFARSALLVAVLVGSAAGSVKGGGMSQDPRSEVVTLGGGCFWCLEAIFEELEGVLSVESGYSGGVLVNPSYKDVCSGETGHAEVVQVTFDPGVIPLDDILRIFFTVHDPTTLNRQGADMGTQYRSAIFYRGHLQHEAAERVVREIDAEEIWDGRIVTQIVPFETFYKAEDYHQEYFASNPRQPYCQIVIAPKVQKFREHFRDRLKTPAK
jgi:methionine-S-sulfoxide reductase